MTDSYRSRIKCPVCDVWCKVQTETCDLCGWDRKKHSPVSRECLKCDKPFLTYSKYIRLCPMCKSYNHIAEDEYMCILAGRIFMLTGFCVKDK